MTAEIAIMNQQAVALATDSAVTVGNGTKIYPSANKLFNLSKYHPVGIMVYSNASFMGIDWETIIKIYRRKLKNKELSSVEEYAKDFLNFMCSRSDLFPKEEQQKNIQNVIEHSYTCVLNSFTLKLKKNMIKKSSLKDNPNIILSSVIEEYYEQSKHYSIIKNLDGSPVLDSKIKQITESNKKYIKKIKNDMFGNLKLTSKDSFKLSKIAQAAILKIGFTNNYTGIVFAGYGKDEVFPAVCHYKIEYLVNGILKYNNEGSNKISFNNRAVIMPFAQSDVISTFVEGIDPEYKNEIAKRINQSLTLYSSNIKEKLFKESTDSVEKLLDSINEKVLKALDLNLAEYEQNTFVKPIMGIVVNLPKPELASMAESMVNLTSFKRHVSRSAETVGGPIDVALISKGDGFVWINRKHYFDPKLNHQFFDNYYKENADE